MSLAGENVTFFYGIRGQGGAKRRGHQSLVIGHWLRIRQPLRISPTTVRVNGDRSLRLKSEPPNRNKAAAARTIIELRFAPPL